MSVIITTPKLTHDQFHVMRDALNEARYQLRDSDWAHQSLVDEVNETYHVVCDTDLGAGGWSDKDGLALEITPRQRQLINTCITQYGIKREHVRDTVLEIVTDLEKAEVV